MLIMAPAALNTSSITSHVPLTVSQWGKSAMEYPEDDPESDTGSAFARRVHDPPVEDDDESPLVDDDPVEDDPDNPVDPVEDDAVSSFVE